MCDCCKNQQREDAVLHAIQRDHVRDGHYSRGIQRQFPERDVRLNLRAVKTGKLPALELHSSYAPMASVLGKLSRM